MEILGVLLGVALLLGLGVVVLVVIGLVKAARAVGEKVERQEAKARRAVENVTLKAKSYTQTGPQGQISAVRLGLRTSLDGTRRVLEGAVGQDGQLGEALALLGRLDAHAAELDGELRMLEREPDAGRVAAKLPELRERADRITHSAETMRWAAQDRMHRFAADELGRLSRECEDEAGALRHWDTVSGASGAGTATAPGASASATAPGASASASGDSAGAGAGAGAAREAGGARRGLTDGRGGRPSAEELLGLADPVAKLAQRLRKPTTGPSAG
ncbi:hypothetical protein [Kitasatospora purpeofusca]|uniref:hypothetical protein n=1 Tax=Kitasatospora purpeofusca TaxID=67352 RepID=UPI002259F3D5|nr:hypothetical protein [Kitasatospora purpeofusca]MCX4752732.1 hypothetical protein [Kitasatospora purpeofusca]WSR32290.1 hypothetical protein OG715_15600 [Kitasatospora purpeofusca]